MTTTVHKLDPRSVEFLHDLVKSTFLDGECYAFAIALHRAFGWSMWGFSGEGLPRHVAVKDPQGRLFDARGFVSEDEFGKPFGYSPPYSLREVCEEDLIREGEPEHVLEHTISRARRLAEPLWPELPWENSFVSKVVAFAEELEALSRKHHIWIRGGVPTARPYIARGEDDEKGYDLYPTDDGITFTIDRRLEPLSAS